MFSYQLPKNNDEKTENFQHLLEILSAIRLYGDQSFSTLEYESQLEKICNSLNNRATDILKHRPVCQKDLLHFAFYPGLYYIGMNVGKTMLLLSSSNTWEYVNTSSLLKSFPTYEKADGYSWEFFRPMREHGSLFIIKEDAIQFC